MILRNKSKLCPNCDQETSHIIYDAYRNITLSLCEVCHRGETKSKDTIPPIPDDVSELQELVRHQNSQIDLYQKILRHS